jgi:hypothetical protein
MCVPPRISGTIFPKINCFPAKHSEQLIVLCDSAMPESGIWGWSLKCALLILLLVDGSHGIAHFALVPNGGCSNQV